MRARSALQLTLAVLAACCAGACGDGAPAVSPRRATLESLIDHVFLPMLADFERASAALGDAAADFCAAPDDAGLERVRDGWQAARRPWKQAEVLAFGPHTLPPWRLASSIDFWPARSEAIMAVLADDAELTGSDPLAAVGAAGKGFAAIEYLLYADDAQLDAFQDGAQAERRCDYLIALAGDLNARARELHDVWDGEYREQLTLAPGTERYDDLNEAFGEIVNNLAFTVELVRDTKLGKPLGLKSGGQPEPELVESRFSGRSIDDALDNLRGIESAFTGGYGGQPARGIGALLRERGDSVDAEFALYMDAAVRALEAIDEPLDQAVVDDRRGVEAAREALRALLVFLQVDLTQQLSVTVTFGGADGD